MNTVENHKKEYDKKNEDRLSCITKSNKNLCQYRNVNNFMDWIVREDLSEKNTNKPSTYTDEQFNNDLEKWYKEPRYKYECQDEISQFQMKILEKALDIANKIKPNN